MERTRTHRGRSVAVLAGVVAIIAVTAACAAPVPSGAQRVSPADGTGYIDPTISGDGSTVLYRREADGIDPYDTGEPRDLVVTRLDTGMTSVVTNIGALRAVSADGTALVHGRVGPEYVDLDTGQRTQLGPSRTLGVRAVALSSDGSTAAVLFFDESRVGTSCVCQLRLKVWRSGQQVVDQLLAGPEWEGEFPVYDRTFIGIDAAGERAFLFRNVERQVVSVDLQTGQISPVPLQFPPLPTAEQIVPYSLEAYLQALTSMDFGSSDGTAFRYTEINGTVAWLLRPDEPPRPLTAGTFTEQTPRLSPNGRWLAYLDFQPMANPSVLRVRYTVSDLTTGLSRVVVESDRSVSRFNDPRLTFSVMTSVADDGRVAFGQWAAPLSGPWPPSIVYVRG